jgi:Clp protease
LKSRLLIYVFLIALAAFISACSFHQILGSDYGYDAYRITVISDIKVGDLRVKHVRKSDSDCKSGYFEYIELSGPIGPDSSAVMEKLLQKIETCRDPKDGKRIVNTVYLNSSGGLLKDGFKMGELFNKYQVSTRVINNQVCASACAFAFLGGKYRSINGNGRLMFHSPYRKKGEGIDCSDPTSVNQVKEYFLSQLGDPAGPYLFDRTMSYCSKSDGWVINADAAKLFGITTK